MAKIVNERIIDDYCDLAKQLPRLFEAYKIDVTWLASKCDSTRGTIYNSIERGWFKPELLRKIVKVINRE